MDFLHASKAFDKINHSVLFEKLKRKGDPGYRIRILLDWYEAQTMHIRWGGSLSQSFHSTNGIKQGGILSPYLFNFYMNDMSVQLNNVNAGCWIGGH